MHRARDGGAYEEIATPTYPEKPADVEELDMWGRPLPWSTVKIWALEAGGADEPGLLWCGTIPGGLFRSHDGGDTWEFMRNLWDEPRRKKWMGGGADLPGIHTICVDPRDARTVRLGVSTGGVWTTRDGGKTWDCYGEGMRAEYVPPELTFDPLNQDVHRMAQSPASPEELWVQHHNGIFHSTDCGRRWREITIAGPSTFGFAVAAHPRQPSTAWFVPAIKDEKRIPVDGKLVVTRTRDGGATFEVLGRGLPQENAFDLVYRHGLDVDETGAALAIGSTTGGLWVSCDEGDSWQCVSTNLPPIHAVRFV
jgi:hypothetical protein